MAGSRQRFNVGRWRVQQERAQIAANEMPPAPVRLATVADKLPKLMKEIGVQQSYWIEVMQSEWSQLVGDALARHTRPGPLEGVSLTVYVTHSVWLHELKRVGYKPLLENLQKRFGAGKIRHLKLLLDPDLARPAAPVRPEFSRPDRESPRG